LPGELESLSPRTLWSYFEQLASIPRPSGHEQRAADWIAAVARGRGFGVQRDRRGNVIVSVPATPGRERAPVLILQGHLDMVCEKNRDVEHDCLRDGILPRLDGDWVLARGTTLGADNGVGVAAALAIATDPALPHGPLELLFTVDEEAGMTGAAQLDPARLEGRTLLNLDSEEDGVLFVGCAGGADSIVTLPLRTEPARGSEVPYRLEIAGLRGGHSGVDIHENRGNAITILARLLRAAADEGVRFGLGPARGGSKSNAIPREAEAIVLLEAEAAARFEPSLRRTRAELEQELAGTGDRLEVSLTRASGPFRPLLEPDRDRLLRLLLALPNGVLAMSRELPGLVETSSSVGILELDGKIARVVASSRSSNASSLGRVVQAIRAVGELAGARVETADLYPGWRPNLSSPILALAREVYRSVWGKEPAVTAVHAGLECGLLGRRIPGLDMVSFGPRIEGAHSPEERVQVSSVQRFFEALREIVDRFSRLGPSEGSA